MACSLVHRLFQSVLSFDQAQDSALIDLKKTGALPKSSDGSDYNGEQYKTSCMDVSLILREISHQAADYIQQLHENQTAMPQILLVGVALWNLHFLRNVSEYREGLSMMADTMQQMLDQVCHITSSRVTTGFVFVTLGR